MRYELSVALPGPPADAIRYLREAIANTVGSAIAEARTAGDVPAEARELLDVDWARLVPDEGESAVLEIDDHQHARARATVRIEPAPDATTAVRAQVEVHTHGWWWFVRFVPRGFYMRFVRRGLRQAESRVTGAYNDWTHGASARLPIDMSSPPGAVAGDAIPVMPGPTAMGTSPQPWMRWDADTVAANHAGSLTDDQASRMRRTALRRTALVMTASGLAGASMGGLLSLAGSIAGAVAAGIGSALVVAGALGYRWGAALSDVRRGACLDSENIVVLPFDRRKRELTLASRPRSLHTLAPVKKLGLVDGARYRVTWLPRSRLIVNAMPVAQPPADPESLPRVTAHWRRIARDGSTVMEGRWSNR